MNDQTATADNLDDKTFKHGDITVQPGDVPTLSIFALAQRGFTHVLGNEVASAVTAYKKSEEGAKASEAEIAAWIKAKREAKLDQILNGTLGIRVAGAPKASGIERVMHTIAVERLRVKLKKFKLTLPTGDKTINVAGKDMGRDALIEAELRHGAVAIREEAERRMQQDAGAVEAVEDLFAE